MSLFLQNAVSSCRDESPPKSPHSMVNIYLCACLFYSKMQFPATEIYPHLNLHIQQWISISVTVSFAPTCSFQLQTWISPWISTFHGESQSLCLSLMLQNAVSSCRHESPPESPHSMVNLHLCACLLYSKMQCLRANMNLHPNLHIQWWISISMPVTLAPRCSFLLQTSISAWISTFNSECPSLCLSLLLQNAVSCCRDESPSESPHSTVNLHLCACLFCSKMQFPAGNMNLHLNLHI